MTFADFWAEWRDKRNKSSAEKAFNKLKPEERVKATERAASWCAEWRKDNPQASHIHASTFLNQKRFLDIEERREGVRVNQEKARENRAKAIKSGHTFLCTNISAASGRELIAAGMVTEDECRKVGVL